MLLYTIVYVDSFCVDGGWEMVNECVCNICACVCCECVWLCDVINVWWVCGINMCTVHVASMSIIMCILLMYVVMWNKCVCNELW